jgi:hypothetical protein
MAVAVVAAWRWRLCGRRRGRSADRGSRETLYVVGPGSRRIFDLLLYLLTVEL